MGTKLPWVAALYAMEQKGFHGTVMDAVVNATKRSQELGRDRRDVSSLGFRVGSLELIVLRIQKCGVESCDRNFLSPHS